MKKIILAASIATAIIAQAEIPAGYYNSLSGKKGEELKTAVKAVAHPDDYIRVEYGKTTTWEAFRNTDVRTINGMTIWWDMYSNKMVPTSTTDGLNIEHSVANSWFGAKDAKDAYADLIHLNPSNEAANNQKGDLPLGEVATISWQNELVKIGAPKAGTAGSASKVFEPADEYKGDFARAYFYIFTVYDGETWKSDQPMYKYDEVATLEPWAVDLLCRWAAEDPVDSKEIKRNDEIFKIQKNRNPFIDYPELIDHIWGGKKDVAFTPGKQAEAIDRPAEPVFTSRRLTAVNTYSSRWWDSEVIGITHGDGDLWVSINGGDYQQYGPGVEIPSASSHGATMSLSAYTEAESNGLTLRSSTAYLTLTGRDPQIDDYTEALYTPVTSDSELIITPETLYILYSSSNGHIMGHNGGTSSSSFMPDAGEVDFQGDEINRLPMEAAIIRFKQSEGGKYLLEVLDALNNRSKGFWNVGGSGNKNTLKSNTGTSTEVKIDDDGTALITFDGGRTLKYNASQPRFTNYNTAQTPVKLARFSSFLDIASAIENVDGDDEGCIAIDGNNIHLPQGWSLFELNGRQSEGKSLEPGIYIARSAKGKAVKILITK